MGNVKKNPTAMAAAIPPRLTSSVLLIELLSPALILNASPIIGIMRGAIIMAPIITATESPRSP